MLNLLILGVKWPPETFIQRKIEGLAKQGVKITVASSIPARTFFMSSTEIHFVRLPHINDPILPRVFSLITLIISSFVRHKGFYEVKNLWSVCRKASFKASLHRLGQLLLLSKFKPDCVHFEWISEAIEYLPFANQIWQVPIVVSCRGKQVNVNPYLPGNDHYIDEIRSVFRQATVIHCVSHAILEEASQYGLDMQKATVIHPAVDPSFFTPKQSGGGSDVFRLISVGSLTWRKGYEYALLAVRTLIDAGIPIEYTIIGSGEEINSLLFTTHDLEIQEHVHFLGNLTPAKVLERLQCSDVFILSSLSEGLSNAVLEAMSVGIPIISTDCGGMKEAIDDGKEGFLVPVRDPIAISEKLFVLWRDPELRLKMGNAARGKVVEKFSLHYQISQLMILYTKLTGKE